MFSREQEFGWNDQVRTVWEQFPIKAGQLSLIPHSVTECGRSNTSSRIRGRTDHCED